MPVILGDDMLIPPSMRRNRYLTPNTETVVSAPSPTGSTTTIELPPHQPMNSPHDPVFIHEERYVPGYGDSVREYIYTTSGSLGRSSHYMRGDTEVEIDITPPFGGLRGAHYARARSVGPSSVYDAYESYDDEYYLEDGIKYGWRPRSVGRYHHHRTVDASAGLVGAHEVVGRMGRRRHRSHSLYRSSSVHRSSSVRRSSSLHRSSSRGIGQRAKHLVESGLAAAGLKHAINHHRQRSYSRGRRGSIFSNEDHWHDDSHRGRQRALRLAEAGLGVAAAGAAKKIYDHRKHRRRSSSASSTSSNNRHEHHVGRNVAAAALGATAAGLAHHMRHRNERRSPSLSSYYYSDDDRHPRHRGRKIAGAALGAAAAGMAGKALRNHYRRGSRSRSTSSSGGSRHRRHSRRHSRIPAAALGTAAAIAAAKRHHDHKKEKRSRSSRSRRSRSRSRSSERHHHGPAQKAAYMMTGGLDENNHRKEHERRASSSDAHRHRRFSESNGSHSSGSHSRGSHSSGGHSRGSHSSGAHHHREGNMAGIEQRPHTPPPHRGIGQKVAYKLGEVVAQEIAGRRGGRR